MHRFIITALIMFGIAASAPQLWPDLFAPRADDEPVVAMAEDAVDELAPATATASVETVAVAATPDPPLPRGRAEIRASRDGHYYVDALINGRKAPVVVDTGATVVALTAETARALGIVPKRTAFTARVDTANGQVRAAPVKLREVRIGGVRIMGVEALILPDSALSSNLLGMSFLSRLKKFEAGGGELVLTQ